MIGMEILLNLFIQLGDSVVFYCCIRGCIEDALSCSHDIVYGLWPLSLLQIKKQSQEHMDNV